MVWRDATVRGRFLLSWTMRCWGGTVAKLFARWTERTSERQEVRAVLLRACEEAGLRGMRTPARQLALYSHALRAMARGMAAWHREVTRQRLRTRRSLARWQTNQARVLMTSTSPPELLR